ASRVSSHQTDERRPRVMGQDDGRHDFDFFFGAWHVANRKRVKPLVPGDDEWIEFDAQVEAHPILGGIGNTDTYKAPDFTGRTWETNWIMESTRIASQVGPAVAVLSPALTA